MGFQKGYLVFFCNFELSELLLLSFLIFPNPLNKRNNMNLKQIINLKLNTNEKNIYWIVFHK